MGKVITLNVDGHYIAVSDRVLGATGASAATTLRIIFDSSWGETSKRVYFTDARGRVPVSMLLTTNMLVLPDDDFADGTSDIYEVQVPAEVLSYPGAAEITVQGVFDEDGDGTAEKVMQTASATFTVLDGSVPGGMPSQKPTVDEALQLQGEIDAIKADIIKAAQAASAVEDAEAAAQEAEIHAATARTVLSVLSDSGVGVDVSARAIPVKWYDGEYTALHDKLFVVRTEAAMVMSLDEDSEPEEPAPIEGDDGEGGGMPGDDPNPGVPIYPTVYLGLVSGWLSDGTLYLSRDKDTGVLSEPFETAGLYLGIDRAGLRYYDITDGDVSAASRDTLSDEEIINPSNERIYQTEDGTVYVWIGYKYLALDLSAIDGDGVSLLERLLNMQERIRVVDDTLDTIENAAAASADAAEAVTAAKLAAAESASEAAASAAAAKGHSNDAARRSVNAKQYSEAAGASAAAAADSAATAGQKTEEAAASAQGLAEAVSDAEAAASAAEAAESRVAAIVGGVAAIVEGVGEPNGIAELDENGKVPASQLPEMNYDAVGAADEVQGNLDTHAGNTTAHITADERATWNRKASSHFVGEYSGEEGESTTRPVQLLRSRDIDAVALDTTGFFPLGDKATKTRFLSYPYDVVVSSAGVTVYDMSSGNEQIYNHVATLDLAYKNQPSPDGFAWRTTNTTSSPTYIVTRLNNFVPVYIAAQSVGGATDTPKFAGIGYDGNEEVAAFYRFNSSTLVSYCAGASMLPTTPKAKMTFNQKSVTWGGVEQIAELPSGSAAIANATWGLDGYVLRWYWNADTHFMYCISINLATMDAERYELGYGLLDNVTSITSKTIANAYINGTESWEYTVVDSDGYGSKMMACFNTNIGDLVISGSPRSPFYSVALCQNYTITSVGAYPGFSGNLRCKCCCLSAEDGNKYIADVYFSSVSPANVYTGPAPLSSNIELFPKIISLQRGAWLLNSSTVQENDLGAISPIKIGKFCLKSINTGYYGLALAEYTIYVFAREGTALILPKSTNDSSLYGWSMPIGAIFFRVQHFPIVARYLDN